MDITLLLIVAATALAAGLAGWLLGGRPGRAELRDSRAQTDAILDAAVDGLITIDAAGRIQEFNRAAERIFGYQAADVRGKNVSMLMPEPYRSAHDGYLHNYKSTGRAKIIGIGREVQGLRKDGSTFPMDLAVGESRVDGRRIFAGVVRDISERKRTEKRLRETEARNSAILEAAADGIITIDERGLVANMNRAAERVFGYQSDEVVGRNVSMLMPEPYRSAHDGYLNNYMTTGRPKIIGSGREVEGLRKDGSTFPMYLSVGEAQTPQGRIFAGIVRDISEMRRAQERLEASEEHFRVLVEGVRDYAIIMVNPDGAVVSWNLGAERLYGWSADEVVGESSARFYPFDAITRDAHEGTLAVARREGRHEEEGWRLRKDGSRFWAHEVTTRLVDAGGQLRGFARISHDMTGHKTQEDELRRAKEDAVRALTVAEREREASEDARAEAERANLAKTKFLAAASHDLRQPVQAIFFFSSVLAQKLRGHAAQGLVEDLQASLEGLNILLESLLDVSRLDAGLIQPKETDFSVGSVLERVAADLQPQCRDKGLEMRVVSSSGMVRSDPALLTRIVQNLVSNAIRYTAQGRILIGCRRRGGHLAIQVWDTGVGIPPDRLEEIFEEFTQLGNPERDRNQGLGLGLAIVRRLARLLGHELDVRSEPGKGSMFAVRVALAPSHSFRARRSALRPLVDGGATAGKLVVLIDDEQVVLRGLSMVLRGWGYEVLAAASEAEALALLSANHRQPSLILADYRLREGHTGTEAVRHIRDLYKVYIPSIIITGDTAPERLREAEASGLSILHKPIQPPMLKEALLESLSPPPARNLH